jgi:hypothetical protein
MIKIPSAFAYTFKTILPKLVAINLSQAKFGSVKKVLKASNSISSDESKNILKTLTNNIGYGITQTKETGQILYEPPVENHLKITHTTA